MSSTPCIRIRNLVKSFPAGASRLEVLKGLDLDIALGAFAVITGSSGSGKSTLLHIIGGLDSIDSGEVVCCGVPIGSMQESRLPSYRKEHVGFIFQNHYLIDDLTVQENLVLPGLMNGLEKELIRRRADGLIERVGLADRREHHPQQLSGGERQRAAVARAFMNDPSMILADEPTGNLDEHNTEIVMQMLTEIVQEKEKTLVLVTHDMDLAATGEEIYKLSEGVLHRI